MRIIVVFSMFVLIASSAWGQTLAFAPLPMENRETILKQFMPMVNYLHDKLGIDVRFEYSDSYAEILQKFRQGKIDFAYLGPLPYVALKKEYSEAVPIAHFNEASGKPVYTCAIVAMADSKVSLENLENKKVALTQALSTCGFLSTNGLLREHGSELAKNLYRYLDKHDAVALSVVKGEYELGGLKTAIGKKYAHLGLAVLAETKPMPSFALIGNEKTLDPHIRDAIRNALTSLDATGRDKIMLEAWGENIRYGAVAGSDGDYDAVRQLLGNTEIPEKGNF